MPVDRPAYDSGMSRLDDMPFARVYPLYVAKVERKGHTKAEVDEVVTWLTGYDQGASASTSPTAPRSATSSRPPN